MGFVSTACWKMKRIGLTLGIGVLLSGTAVSNPNGPQVRHGQVNYSPGSQAQIQQLTDKAIVDWQSFSIGASESLRILQPGQLSVLLNRVTGGDPSLILGSLTANGQVFLINPGGILFGPNSSVNVGGLVASTLNITDQDFLAGKYDFSAVSGQDLAAVVNQGRIEITNGGYAVLIGPTVLNEGTIIARAGNVVLAGGEQATLNLDGQDLVHYALKEKVGEGTVLLAPGMLSDTMADIFGVNPSLRADSLVRLPDGSVKMLRSSGTTVQAGTVNVDGTDGQKAGSIALDSTDVTIVGRDSVTTASGHGKLSSGGEILVLSSMDGLETSRGFTDVQSGALLSVAGGQSGDGGFVEVSGDGVNLLGEVDLSATDGAVGTFLLDPVVVTIVDGNNAPTSNPATANTTIGDQWFSTLTGDLVLQSTGDIIFDASAPGGVAGDGQNVVAFGNDLTLQAGNDGLNGPGVIEFKNDGWRITGNGGNALDNLRIIAPGNISLGDATLEMGDSFFVLDSEAAIDMGTATVTMAPISNVNALVLESVGLLNMNASNIVVNGTGGGGNKGLRITSSAGDIELGSSVLNYNDRLTNSGSKESRISAAGDIRASGTPDWSILGRADIAAGGSINLPNFAFDNPRDSGTSTNFRTTTGSITLGNGGINNGLDLTAVTTLDIVLESAGGVTLNNFDIKVNDRSDVSVTAVGDINFSNVKINEGALNNSTGVVSINSTGGAVDLGNATITVEPLSELNALSVQSSGLLNLGSATMTVDGTGGGFSKGVRFISSAGDIDLGSSSLTYNDRLTNSGFKLSTISAAGDIRSSGSVDWSVLGRTEFTAAGSINLPNFSFDNPLDSGTASLFQATGGGITLANGGINTGLDFTTVNTLDITLDSSGGISLNNFDIKVNDRSDVSMTAAGDISLANVKINEAAQNNSTGFVNITSTGGALNLGNATIRVEPLGEFNSLFLQSADTLDLGSSDIRVDGVGGSFNKGLRIVSTASDVDLGTSTLFFNDLVTSSGSLLNQITAAGNIRSSGAVDWHIGGTTTFSATGSLDLPNFSFDNPVAGGSFQNSTRLQATNGSINLGNGGINSGLDLTTAATLDIILESGGQVTLNNFDLKVNNRKDVGVTAAGDIRLTDVNINEGALDNSTGVVSFNSTGGALNLGNSTIRVEPVSENIALFLQSSGTLDLGSSDIRVDGVGGSFNKGLRIVSTGSNVDLGSSQLVFNDVVTSSGSSLNQITAAGDILTTGVADWQVGGRVDFLANGAIDLDGFSLDNPSVGGTGIGPSRFRTTNGGLSLKNGGINTGLDFTTVDTLGLIFESGGATNLSEFDINLDNGNTLSLTSAGNVTMDGADINRNSPPGGTGDISIFSQAGLSLGTGSIRSDRDIDLMASGVLDLGTKELFTPRVLSLSSNTEVRSSAGSFQARDIEIFGFNPTTLVRDPNRAVPNGVAIGLSTQNTADTIDLTIFSDSDIEVLHSGNGTLNLVTAGGPQAIRSTGGGVNIDAGNGTVRLNSVGSGLATVHADSDAVVQVKAAQIVEANGGNLDLFSGGEVIVGATVSAGTAGSELEVQGRSITLDLSQAGGAQGALRIIGPNEFLKAIGNNSTISITDTNTTNRLSVVDDAGRGSLDLAELTATDIHYVDLNGVKINSVVPGNGKTLAIEVLNNGDIIGGPTAGADLDFDGNLLLKADGDIGTQAAPIRVEAGTVSVQAGSDSGDEIHLSSRSDALVIADVQLQNHRNEVVAQGQGVRGGGDIDIRLESTNPSVLDQRSTLQSTNGSVGISLQNGSISQQAGSTIAAGNTVAFSLPGDVGTFDSGTASEVSIQASSVVLDVGGDAILQQASGDLTVESQAVVGGNTYTASANGQDRRIRVANGSLTVNSDITATGETALVTGTGSVLSQGTGGGNIVLNGNVTSGTSLVVLAGGNVTQQSGSLTAPQLGLGSVTGTVGSTANPINIQTDQMAINPLAGSVADPNGFVNVAQVGAVGVTVQQGTPLPDPPPTPQPPTPGPPPTPTPEPGEILSPGNSVGLDNLPELGVDESPVLAQNNTQLIDEALQILLELDVATVVEVDPTIPPIQITDEDYLQKKFRR